MRSSLSPFFGALYLKPLDEAFSNRDNVFYVRYMGLLQSKDLLSHKAKNLVSALC